MSQNSIGAQLKDARMKKTLSFEDVHGRIKIHPRVLQLLEEDKFDKLPSPLFAKSFLKSYSEFLEMNTAEILSAYEKEGAKDPEQILFIRPVDQRPVALIGAAGDRNMTLLIGAASAALLLLFGLGIYMVKHAPAKSVAPPKKTVAPVKADIKKTSDWLRSTEDGNFPKIASNAPIKLGMRALDTVWLKITCDEKVLFQGLLKKGAAESWSAKNSIEVWSGNASNMMLAVNGMSIGSPGKGAVKKIIISRQGVRASS